jgi:hypothetical protein
VDPASNLRRNIKQKVEAILRDYEKKYGKSSGPKLDPRNNDAYLVILYLRNNEPDVLRFRCPNCNQVHQGWIDWEAIERISGLFEDIRRARQKLNETGLYLPTLPEVLVKRRRKQQDMQSGKAFE